VPTVFLRRAGRGPPRPIASRCPRARERNSRSRARCEAACGTSHRYPTPSRIRGRAPSRAPGVRLAVRDQLRTKRRSRHDIGSLHRRRPGAAPPAVTRRAVPATRRSFDAQCVCRPSGSCCHAGRIAAASATIARPQAARTMVGASKRANAEQLRLHHAPERPSAIPVGEEHVPGCFVAKTPAMEVVYRQRAQEDLIEQREHRRARGRHGRSGRCGIQKHTICPEAAEALQCQ